MEPVTVLIADDHPVFRDGIRRVIASWPELRLVSEVSDGLAVLAAIRQDPPQVALVDLRLPELDGVQIATAVTREQLPTRVVILSAYDDEELVYRALRAGAAGYLTKDSSPEQIARAVLSASRGATVLTPELTGGVANQIRRRDTDDSPLLTEREREVLELLCDGLSAPQIAQRLYLGTTTVKTHLGHLYEKLGVSDRAAAVAEAMRRGLIE